MIRGLQTGVLWGPALATGQTCTPSAEASAAPVLTQSSRSAVKHSGSRNIMCLARCAVAQGTGNWRPREFFNPLPITATFEKESTAQA